MPVSKNKKRFIAGAECPQCKTIDSIALTLENAVETLTCVSCDYTQTQTPNQAKSATRQFEQIIGVFDPSEPDKE
ncbi:YheV family putative zinc ribbon protein [Psychromonas sp. SP041]|uniref:YheV family putative zinc ribbon protein n=1 Tax=Psychromonas sp. SP041 TaxID=1365007 RepID=UPI00040F2B34|nr:YheV family putative zinc ribbon protein [Psychromonas sp. SP041]